MMGERGVAVNRISFSWRVDETYIRVKGWWKYLYQAIDKDGNSLDK